MADLNLRTTRFDEVSCDKPANCEWPECDCKKRRGTFACPICGKDSPHHHDIDELRPGECSGCMNPLCEDCFDQQALAALEAQGRIEQLEKQLAYERKKSAPDSLQSAETASHIFDETGMSKYLRESLYAPFITEHSAQPSIAAETGGLHPQTAALVDSFASALKEKLLKAQQKYGYSDNWRTDDWEDECRLKLREHVEKGDPLDVAAYAAFCWARGWSTGGKQ